MVECSVRVSGSSRVMMVSWFSFMLRLNFSSGSISFVLCRFRFFSGLVKFILCIRLNRLIIFY